MAGVDPELRIIPFRGEYFKLNATANKLVRGLICPLADPKYPFLGVHLTRTIQGEVLAGPNAILNYSREGYISPSFNLQDTLQTLSYPGFLRMAFRNLGAGLSEVLRSWSAPAFARQARKLVPELRIGDFLPARAGIRAQAIDRYGRLMSDFHFAFGEGSLHVLNSPSPAATASLAIGEYIANQVMQRMGA
jgi:L-2-hydroxyglutarate oxidase LhgO